MSKTKEFDFKDSDFQRIRELVKELTGINLSEQKRDMVYSRLARRIRDVGLGSFADYINLLNQAENDEIGNFVNAITTNLTSFFREQHHFDYLAKTVIPYLCQQRQHERKIRVWSAGCSTGEEPYSLAMTFAENMPVNENWDLKILATDLDTNVISTAKAGLYAEERMTGVSNMRTKKWFLKGRGEHDGYLKVRPELQKMITFKQLNLMGDWPMKGQFDVIFCRNVVIYFDKPTQAVLFDRYANILKDDGTLFVGHSESLFKVTKRFELIGHTTYKKSESAVHGQ